MVHRRELTDEFLGKSFIFYTLILFCFILLLFITYFLFILFYFYLLYFISKAWLCLVDFVVVASIAELLVFNIVSLGIAPFCIIYIYMVLFISNITETKTLKVK